MSVAIEFYGAKFYDFKTVKFRVNFASLGADGISSRPYTNEILQPQPGMKIKFIRLGGRISASLRSGKSRTDR